ncbi:MAG: hypothetical protein HY782_07290 [Chloroflexi bacterium]|nr:hypothetical protein [Chloroflexota bacterium]
MTRTFKVLITTALLVFLAFAIYGNTQASTEPQTIRVLLKDYHVELSQFVVTPGRAVRFVVVNDGSMPHQLVVQPYLEARALDWTDMPVVSPFTLRTLEQTFTAGVYRVSCGVADHAEKGMVNVLVANSPQKPPAPLRADVLIPLLALALGSALIIGDSMGLSIMKRKT